MVRSIVTNNDLTEDALRRFVGWAKGQPDILVVLNQGSRARTDHPSDQWADLDLIIFTTDRHRYLNSSDWLESFGKPIITHLEKTAVGDELERRAIFEGGLDVDFSILLFGTLAENIEHPSLQDLDMIRRGVRVLLDKTGTVQAALDRLSRRGTPGRMLPSRDEFEQLVKDFLYHVYWTAKKLRRGEIWSAQACCDGYMKRRLLTMIEWNTLAVRGRDTDVWFNGRYMEEWASPDTLKMLRRSFSYYDAKDVERALFATTDLFLRLARETAGKIGYNLSKLPVTPVIELAHQCLDRKTARRH